MTDILLEAPRPGKEDGEESAYYVKNPDGKVQRHARASSYTGILDDDYILRRYDDRMLAHGLGRRKDLAALARSHDPKVDRAVYDRDIIPAARAAAETEAEANHGTSFHKDTELLDQGAAPAALDPELVRHYRAYLDTIAAIPMRIIHEHTERVVILDGHLIAGTIDRVVMVLAPITITFRNGRKVHLQPGDLIILDIKSGKWGLQYNGIKWPVQCAIYSHHTATWHPHESGDPELGERGPAIGVRQDVALVFHLNARDPDATPELHWLDLEFGYDAFLTAVETKGHRADSKRAHCQYTDHLPTVIQTQMEAWCRARLEVIRSNPAATACLTRMWPLRAADDTPIRYGDQPTPEQTTTLLNLLDRIEGEYSLPFTPQPGVNGGTTQPTQETPDNPGETQ
jgi:hypothetical protein